MHFRHSTKLCNYTKCTLGQPKKEWTVGSSLPANMFVWNMTDRWCETNKTTSTTSKQRQGGLDFKGEICTRENISVRQKLLK